ncbi:uncharacterized protein GGS25DRAFT_477178 [Hypoxylon fragiforme]|uniref:uncharacterized protein n=1 Tax=Hypoxylon fragiforme TaxID=63214 RepID=UPI0020C6B617|nr:uncharacterized protein GGS25DRAFT_477178 [Hypoxylon fragiforme]KAI2612811.1 hypothetical protein GGS25DRAFT_477178 [Hypoxylon fragiforme]
MWLSSKKRPSVILSPLHLLLFVSYALGQGQRQGQGQGQAQADPSPLTTTTDDTIKSPSSIPSVEPTCEFRTINYITHTLPQQCLTSAPTTFSTPESISVTITSSSTVADSTPSSPSSTDGIKDSGSSDRSSSSSGSGSGSDSNSNGNGNIENNDLDADGNDLSTGAFMSFEEWKRMMLAKSGQDELEPRNRRTKDARGDPYPADDFDSFGDEGEVSLDFDAYSDRISEIASSTKPSQKEKGKEGQVEKVTYDEGLAQGYRSKDAGTTCKERFSYASFDAGATVKKASPGAKNPKAILVENKDSYMLLECSMQNKFVVVELSDDILVDTVVLANFEFFSSMIRHFRVSVSDRYPVKLEKWKILGTFQARNSRDIQPFLVQNPQIWARYIRIEILSHYGNEYYCPMSLLRVHGTRMLDSWKEADPADLENEDESSKTAPEFPEETETVEVVEDHPPEEVVVAAESPRIENQTAAVLEQSEWVPFWKESYFRHSYPFDLTCGTMEAAEATSQPSQERSQNTAVPNSQPMGTFEQTNSANSSTSSSGATTTPSSTSQITTETARPASSTASSDTSPTTAIANSTESDSIVTPSPDSVSVAGASSTTTTTVSSPSVQTSSKGKTTASTSLKPPSSRSSVISKNQPSGSPTTPRNNKTSSTTSSAASGPTVQESFFKSITKRIQALESNTTLSLQYIESQSKFLQEALARLERRQVAKVDLFLDTLNKTVLGELREVRTQYDQIWQSTIIALETQREQSEREIVALSSRLGVLADEVIFQKRMAIFQSLLLLGCLILVIFSRGSGPGGVGGGVGMGMGFTESAYYPSQFFNGLASPIFPSTPRAASMKGPRHRDASNPLLSVEDADASPIRGDTPPQQQQHQAHLRRNLDLEQTPNSPSSTPSSLRHRPRRSSRDRDDDEPDDVDGHRRPSPSRASTEPPSANAVDYYHAPTPSSVDIGYDSEPALTPILRRNGGTDGHGNENGNGEREGGYYADDSEGSRQNGASSYLDLLDRRSERQLTPSLETVDPEHMSLSSRPALPHMTSARKPLPALPEDPD